MGNLSDKSCVRCGKDTAGYNFKSGKMCVFCFYDMYGGIILNATNGEYYGGHKAYVAGGFARKYELGQMLLTDKFFIFFNDNDNDDDLSATAVPYNQLIEAANAGNSWGYKNTPRLENTY